MSQKRRALGRAFDLPWSPVLRCEIMPVPRGRIVCACAAALLAAGCAGAKAAAPAASQPAPPAAEEARPARPTNLEGVARLQDAHGQELQRLAGELKALDAQQGFLVAELKSVNEQLAKLKASVDEAKSAFEDSRRATPVTPPPSAPAAARPAAPAPPAPLPPPAPRGAGPGAAVPVRNPDADKQYAAALAKLRAGEDGQAALEFTEFVAQFPNHPQAAAAQNWIGEAYFRQNDFRQAAAEFQKTVDNYTQTAQVAEALLKIGLCKRALGDAAGAKAAWDLVIQQYPKSEAAAQARSLIAGKAGAPARPR